MAAFFINMFFSALGALLGVVGGVIFQEKREADILASKRRNLRRKIIEVFQFNLIEMGKMLSHIERGEVPTFRLDSDSMLHLLFHGPELFEERCWAEKLNWERYQLIHINAQVDFLNNLITDNLATNQGVFQRRLLGLSYSLKETSPRLEKLLLDYKQAVSRC